MSKRIWSCDPNAFVCEVGHPLLLYKAGFRVVYARVDADAFLECQECSPARYFYASIHHEPSPVALCYALSRESFHEWQKAERLPPRPELLFRLADPDGRCFNPRFQRARPA